MKWATHLAALLASLALLPIEPASADDAGQAALLVELSGPGRIVLMRHALAPGTGDPAHFQLGDCATQRNLDAHGRRQARAAGAALRGAGIDVAAVYSSQWCRCLETAELLAIGAVQPLPALNSFYEDRASEADRTTAMRRFLADLPRDGGLTVFVTHQVNITALTGESVASGEMKVLRLLADGGYQRLGSLAIGG